MSTKSENSEIAVLQVQVGSLLDATKRIEDKLDKQNENYVPRTEFLAFKKQYWLSHTLTAVLTAIIVALATYFILHKVQP